MFKRVLMIATVPSMIGQFNMNNIEILQEMGYQVDVAADFTDVSVWPERRTQQFRNQMKELGCNCFQIDFSRKPLNLKRHLRSYKEVVNLIRQRQYSFIHTHTPIASAITRLATKTTKNKVIYTAHGFHFYKGAPIRNWLLYYPVEKWLSRYTDVLITINKEDYKRGLGMLHAKSTVYVPGIGLDTKKYEPSTVRGELIRKELGIKTNEIMLLSVGELNDNKNHISVIRAIRGLDLVYVIVGKGEKSYELEVEAKECSVDLRLMGFRNDVVDFYNAADIYILPSIREGLNVSLMEAMSCGTACCAGKIRGNVDLISNNKVLFNPLSLEEIRRAVLNAIEMKAALGRENKQLITAFDKKSVMSKMEEIYAKMN